MTPRRLVRAASIAGAAIFMMAASASASPITFNTNAATTVFVSSNSLTLNQSSGVAATLTFNPSASSVSGVPSSVAFGDFTLVCATCSTQAIGTGAFFNAFSFNLVVTDLTDGATGKFVGNSTGGSVWSDVSQITITWAPLVLGPGTVNALTGNFGPTFFATTSFTAVVAPNSGTPPGQSTVQGFINTTAIPEPGTLSVIGGGLLGLGLLRRKKVFQL